MNRVYLAILVLFLVGCSGQVRPPVSDLSREPSAMRDVHVAASDSANVRKVLMAQFSDWQGVDYQLGGLSKDGIDCSGFVYLTYRTKLGQALPRTTKLQSQVGMSVARHELRAGDLVFFKTGIKVRHVGIFIGESKFIHASTSQGVTISSLDNRYWASNYWMAKRIK